MKPAYAKQKKRAPLSRSRGELREVNWGQVRKGGSRRLGRIPAPEVGDSKREVLQPSGGCCCSRAALQRMFILVWSMKDFTFRGVPPHPPRQNTGSRIRRMRGTCSVSAPCHLRRLLLVSSLGISIHGWLGTTADTGNTEVSDPTKSLP